MSHQVPLELRPSALIEALEGGLFQESEGGQEALILPVRDAADKIVDIVAWFIGADRPWYRLRGIGEILGAKALAQSRWPNIGYPAHKPELVLYESPKRWLAAVAPNAICILDWTVNLNSLFAGIDCPIVCESEEIRAHFEETAKLQEPIGLPALLRVLS